MSSYTKIILKNNIRIYLSNNKDIVQQVFDHHKYPPFPNLILANAITAFTPIKFLYDTNNIVFRIKTNGAMKNLILEIKDSSIRALISNPNIVTEYDKEKYNEIPLILGIGDIGTIDVSRVINNERFNSTVKIAKGDIVTDLAYYLNVSDQVFSAVINDVRLNDKDPQKILKAKNVLFQLLPSANEEDINWIETFIKENDFTQMSIYEYEEKINGELLDIKKIDAKCWCSKNRLINAIKVLSSNEIDELFKGQAQIESKCDFCNKIYNITPEEIKN